MSMRALYLPDLFTDAGLTIVVEPGFETRGADTLRPDWLVEHHTASRPPGNAPSLGIVRDGRDGAAPVTGPLCNWLTARDGVIHLVASGTANHAGKGSYPDGTTGNFRSYGDEAENDGVGEPWPEHQLEVIARAAAAVCRYHGWSAERQIGHKEFALPRGRKIDPTYDMRTMRARTAGHLAIGAPPIKSEEDDDMGTYLYDTENDVHWHLYGERCRQLSREQFLKRQSLARLGGKDIVPARMHPWAIAKFLMDLGLIADPVLK